MQLWKVLFTGTFERILRGVVVRINGFRVPHRSGGQSLTDGGLVFRSSEVDMLKKISENRCCEVIFAGHQRGANNNGRVVGLIPCPDSGQIGKKVRAAMIEGGCSNCSLFLAACEGGGNDKRC